jgi:dipeptidyl aminopeptidase/acylaminoacyl peptidase
VRGGDDGGGDGDGAGGGGSLSLLCAHGTTAIVRLSAVDAPPRIYAVSGLGRADAPPRWSLVVDCAADVGAAAEPAVAAAARELRAALGGARKSVVRVGSGAEALLVLPAAAQAGARLAPLVVQIHGGERERARERVRARKRERE